MGVKKFSEKISIETVEKSQNSQVLAEKNGISPKPTDLAEIGQSSQKKEITKENGKKKKGPRKGRKNKKILENSAETNAILMNAFGNAGRRNVKGLFFLPAIRAEEESEKKNAKRAIDFAENFNEGDFVPDVLDEFWLNLLKNFGLSFSFLLIFIILTKFLCLANI